MPTLFDPKILAQHSDLLATTSAALDQEFKEAAVSAQLPKGDPSSSFDRHVHRRAVALYSQLGSDVADAVLDKPEKWTGTLESQLRHVENFTLGAVARRFLPEEPEALATRIIGHAVVKSVAEACFTPSELVEDINWRRGLSDRLKKIDVSLSGALSADARVLTWAVLSERRIAEENRLTLHSYFPGEGRYSEAEIAALKLFAADPANYDSVRGRRDIKRVNELFRDRTGRHPTPETLRVSIDYHSDQKDTGSAPHSRRAWEDKLLIQLALDPNIGYPIDSHIAPSGMWVRVAEKFNALAKARDSEARPLSPAAAGLRFAQYLADESFRAEKSSEQLQAAEVRAERGLSEAITRREIRAKMEEAGLAVSQHPDSPLDRREASFALVEKRGQKIYSNSENEKLLELVATGRFKTAKGINWTALAEELGTGRDPIPLGQHYRELLKSRAKKVQDSTA